MTTTFAGQWGPEDFQGRTGDARPDTVVKVYEMDGTTLATLWADRNRAVALANPLPTNVAAGSAGLDRRANGILFAEPGQYVLSGLIAGIERLRTTITVDKDPAEPSSASGGGHFRHDQTTPLQVWTIFHGLGFMPGGIYVEDSAGSHHEPSVEQIDVNTIALTFVGAMDGFALLS